MNRTPRVSQGFQGNNTSKFAGNKCYLDVSIIPRNYNKSQHLVDSCPGVYMDKVLNEKDLPVKLVAYGRCFRTEAGAAGAAGKGLYRVHQFTKVILVSTAAYHH